MIEPLGRQHIKAVAALHRATLTGLLTELGTSATEAFYAGCVGTPLAIGLVDLRESRLRGFVLGSSRPDALRRDVLRNNPVGIVSALAAAALTRPASFLALITHARRSDHGNIDLGAPDLTYLSVAPDARHEGVGASLVHAFGKRIQATGVAAYELSVDDDNLAGIAFYERLGFRLTGRYREFGRPRCRYRLVMD